MEEGRDTRRVSELNASSPKRVLFCISPASTFFCDLLVMGKGDFDFLSAIGHSWHGQLIIFILWKLLRCLSQHGCGTQDNPGRESTESHFFSTILVFLLWFQLAQGSVWRAGVRQGNHDGIRICHSLRAQVIPTPLNILRIITDTAFLQPLFEKNSKSTPHLERFLWQPDSGLWSYFKSGQIENLHLNFIYCIFITQPFLQRRVNGTFQCCTIFKLHRWR